MIRLYRSGKRIEIPVDATFAEFHDLGGESSEYSREDGALAADHIILAPVKLDIICSVARQDRASTTIDQLLRIRGGRGVYEVLTDHVLYDNMALLAISWGNEAPLTGRAELTLHFKEMPVAGGGRPVANEAALRSQNGGDTAIAKTASAEIDAGRVGIDSKHPLNTHIASSFP